jgi:Protein of unknown function (DUF2786)
MTDQTTTQEAIDAAQKRREQMIAKIRALRAKTAAAGASEHEALAAAEKAAELMDAYEVTEDDLAAMREKRFAWTKGAANMANGRSEHRVLFCTAAIAKFTGTRVVYCFRRVGPVFAKAAEYFGEPADVEMATWLHDTVRVALDAEYDTWRRARGSVGQGAKASFQAGMVIRINERLRALMDERKRAQDGGGRALVVCKDQLVQTAWQEAYPRLNKARNRTLSGRNGNAFGAGTAAGDRVGLGRPVGSESRQTLRVGFKG